MIIPIACEGSIRLSYVLFFKCCDCNIKCCDWL